VLRCFLIVCVSSTLLAATATAQTVPLAWAPLSHVSSSPLYALPSRGPLNPGSLIGEQSDTVARQIRPTYWKEGGIVVALPAAAFMGWLVHGLCADSDGGGGGCTGAMVGGALGGAVVGFLAGALIGGQFPKHPKSAPVEPS
jgi:hypothetical protein